jgi:hypothetical protein
MTETVDPIEGFHAFRDVVKSLMRDASQWTVEPGADVGRDELRERLRLVGHYVSYTLRYCDECPLVPEACEEKPKLSAMDLPGAG